MAKNSKSDLPTEGWGVVRGTEEVAHFYRRQNALCGKVTLYTGPLTPGVHGSPCAACEARLERIKNGPRLTSAKAAPKTRKAPAKGRTRG